MKTVFITGATGAIGSALVPLFLDEPDTAVRLLLRAASPEQLSERLQQLFRFWQREPDDPLLAGRVEAVRGDVSLPWLGMEEAEYRRLTAEVTHVIHAAGNVKLNQTLAEAQRNAVDAARHVVEFAHACRTAGRFEKLEHVSTVGVAGRTRGLVPEEPLTHSRRFHNTYEQAKADAEVFVLGEIERGLPATIHRPSMVVGDSRTGKIPHFQVFYHLSEFLSGARTRGFVPDTGRVKLDVIPVDYVARALHAASERPDAVGRVLHLCSGPDHAMPLSAVTERVRRVFHRHGQALPSLRRLRQSWVRVLLPLATWLSRGGTRRAFQSLPFFLAYLDEEQVFDNRHTQAFFGAAGPSVPAVDEYLDTVLDYYWAVKRRPRASVANAAVGA
jgi:thioester reductase-like protein